MTELAITSSNRDLTIGEQMVLKAKINYNFNIFTEFSETDILFEEFQNDTAVQILKIASSVVTKTTSYKQRIKVFNDTIDVALSEAVLTQDEYNKLYQLTSTITKNRLKQEIKAEIQCLEDLATTYGIDLTQE